MSASPLLAPLDVEALRKEFPILQWRDPQRPQLVYLDNAASTQVPQCVLDEVVRCHTQYYANVHRGVHHLSERSTEAYEQAREKVREFLNAESVDEIVFTSGTTASINTIARAWGDANVSPGDEILLTEMEHHANIVPWQQLAERTGAVLRFAPIAEDGQLDRDAFDDLLSPRTKLVALAAVSNVLGTINPLADLIPKAHSVGALVLVDAAQSVPHAAVDVRALGADFLAFSAHKMCGLGGVGVLYGKRERLEAMPPFLGGGSMIRRVEWEGFATADLPTKFEAGTPPIVAAVALGAAIDFLKRVGMDAISAHEHALVKIAYDALKQVPGVRILGPEPAHRAGLVSFTLVNSRGTPIHGHDLADLLDRQGVAVRAGHHCAMPLHKKLGVSASTRASFYLYNTAAEVEHFLEALDGVRAVFDKRHVG